MDINFEYYKIFYYVAKYKNITRAAAALGSNQPNVTRVMKLLEEGLQCKLLVREARGIALTQEGERLYAHVEAAFHQLLKAQEEIGAQLLDGTGTVEIGATETALHLFLLDALRSFKETCPRVRIKIHNHTTPDILKRLAYGRLDLAVITTPFETTGHLVAGKLTGFREILAGSRTGGWEKGRRRREKQGIAAECFAGRGVCRICRRIRGWGSAAARRPVSCTGHSFSGRMWISNRIRRWRLPIC